MQYLCHVENPEGITKASRRHHVATTDAGRQAEAFSGEAESHGGTGTDRKRAHFEVNKKKQTLRSLTDAVRPSEVNNTTECQTL